MYTVKATNHSKVIHAVKVNELGQPLAIPLCQKSQTEEFGLLENGVAIANCPTCIQIVLEMLDKATDALPNHSDPMYRKSRHDLLMLIGRFREIETASRNLKL